MICHIIKNGTLVIGNTRVQDEKIFLERGLRKILPRLNLRDIFKIYGLNIQFTQWKKHRAGSDSPLPKAPESSHRNIP